MKSRSILLTAIIMCLLMITCGKDNPSAPDPDPDPNPSDNPDLVSLEIGPDGGEITSKDGKLTLIFPPAALGNTETITIVPLDDENSGDEFDELDEEVGIGNAWELGPGGLEFDKPVTATFTSDQEPVYDADSLAIFAEFLFTSNNGNIESLDSLRVEANLDENTVTVSGQLSHFSPLVSLQENNGVSFRILNVPDMLEVEDLFEANAFIASSQAGSLADLVTLDGPAIYTDRSGAPIEPDFSPLSREMDRNENNHFEGNFLYGCNDTGLGVFGADLGVIVTFDLDSGPVEAESYSNFITTIECVEVMPDMFTLTVDKEGEGSGTIVSNPDGIDCGVDCESDDADFEDGVGAILAATAAEGSVFDGWSGDVSGTCENTTNPCTVIMDQNKSVTATFSPAEDSAPSINRFGGEITGPRSIRFELRVEYDQELSILDAAIDPDDGSGNQEVQLEETDAENEYQGELEWEYGEGTMFPVMPEAIVMDTESGESEHKNFELKKVTVTVEKAGDGDGTITGTAFQGEVLNCPPGCDTDNAEVIAATFEGGIASVQLNAESDDNSEFTGWAGDLLGSEGCEGTGNCTVFLNEDRTITAEFTSSTEGEILETALVFLALTGNPEALMTLYDRSSVNKSGPFSSAAKTAFQNEEQFGDLSGTYPVAISGAEGFVVMDLLTKDILLELTPDAIGTSIEGLPAFGVMGLSREPAGPNSPAVFLLFGETGFSFWETDGSGFVQQANQQPAFDAFPAGGNLFSSYGVTASTIGVQFVSYDESQKFFRFDFFNETGISSSHFDGDVVSAWMPDRETPEDTPVLVLDNAPESGLYLTLRDGSIPMRAADVGADARKVRCIEDGSGTGNLVCAVSVFGDDRLAILTWDGETMPSLTGFADVGDGPVGIDLWPLSNGNIAIVSTGFNDHTVTETEISPDGNVLTNSTRNTLDGCENPGHAIYIEDTESLKVVGTCYNSDSYFIMESEL